MGYVHIRWGKKCDEATNKVIEGVGYAKDNLSNWLDTDLWHCLVDKSVWLEPKLGCTRGDVRQPYSAPHAALMSSGDCEKPGVGGRGGWGSKAVFTV